MRIEKIKNNEELNKRFLYLKLEVEKYFDNLSVGNYSKLIEQICRAINSKDYYWMKSILIASDKKNNLVIMNISNRRDYNTFKTQLARLNEEVYKISSKKRFEKK